MRLVVVLMIALSSIASAQPGETPVLPPPKPQKQATGGKDPSIAVLLSLGVPVAGVLTIAASDSDTGRLVGAGALLFGPSTGRWYAGESGSGTLALRLLGGGSMVVGLSMTIGAGETECEYNCASVDAQERNGMILFWTGAGLWVGSSIADIVLAKRAADRTHLPRGVALTPGMVGTTTRTPGLVLSGRF